MSAATLARELVVAQTRHARAWICVALTPSTAVKSKVPICIESIGEGPDSANLAPLVKVAALFEKHRVMAIGS